jgi:hypothetical protein
VLLIADQVKGCHKVFGNAQNINRKEIILIEDACYFFKPNSRQPPILTSTEQKRDDGQQPENE